MTRGMRVGIRPNTPQWLGWRAGGITASDSAAILGLSPYTSAFALWWRKHDARHLLADGLLPVEDARSQRFEIGHALEPVLHRFFASEQLPQGWRIGSGGCWQGRGVNAWLRATPDRVLYDRPGSRTPVAVVDFKTSAGHEFGDDPGDGVPEVPVQYRVQMLHQMACVGVDVGWLSVLTGEMKVAHYRIVAQPGETATVVDAAWEFEKSLRDGQAPPVDGHDATTATLKRQYSDLEDVEVEVDADLADEFAAACAAVKQAEAAKAAASNRLLEALGNGRRAMCDGRKVATRSVSYRRSIDREALQADHPEIHDKYYRPSTKPTISLKPPAAKPAARPITGEKEPS